MDKNQKRVVLVTGATGGLGTAMCEALYKEGYRVLANYRSKDKADGWKMMMDSKNIKVDLFYGEVSDYASVESMVKEIEEKVGPVDVLVNNAGITRDTAFRKMSYEQWRDVLSSNLDSVFNCTRNVINGMIDRNFGRIINISSVNGQRGQFGQANYSAAKAGMHGFTKTLAMEVARKGVTVNTISPGYIGTDMVMR
jgi:acetoacetyl-CoA reductase